MIDLCFSCGFFVDPVEAILPPVRHQISNEDRSSEVVSDPDKILLDQSDEPKPVNVAVESVNGQNDDDEFSDSQTNQFDSDRKETVCYLNLLL
jgi:hypothetical protein